MMLSTNTMPRCLSHRYSSGIYEFVLQEATIEAFSELLDLIAEAGAATRPGETLRFIVDSSTCGNPPLNASFQAAQKWLMTHPDYVTARTVFITRPDLMRDLAFSFVRLLNNSARRWKWRFMDGHQRSEILHWLMAND